MKKSPTFAAVPVRLKSIIFCAVNCTTPLCVFNIPVFVLVKSELSVINEIVISSLISASFTPNKLNISVSVINLYAFSNPDNAAKSVSLNTIGVTVTVGASFVPVIVITKFFVSVAPWSSVTVIGIVSSKICPTAKYWYALSVASNVYVPSWFITNPATVDVVVYIAVELLSTSVEVIVPLNNESSSFTATSVIVSNIGASFTGFTVTLIVWTVDTVPSFTVSVITALPLKFSFGVNSISPFAFIIAVPFVAVTLDVNISASISFAVNVIVNTSSSFTVAVVFTVITGAELIGIIPGVTAGFAKIGAGLTTKSGKTLVPLIALSNLALS